MVPKRNPPDNVVPIVGKPSVKPEWLDEPDEVKWIDEHTGLRCLVLRNEHMLNLCGYVSVGKDHPFFGKKYESMVTVDETMINRVTSVDDIGIINLLLEGHKADFEKNTLPISLAIHVHGGLTYFDDHAPNRKPNGEWWFGFDCAHAGDMVPELERIMMRLSWMGLESYRNMAYVKDQCQRMARQLYLYR